MDLTLLKWGRMFPRHSSPAEFAGPPQVRAYWEGLRKDGTIPGRAELDPRGMADVLDRVFLAEAVGQGLVQVRIAGSALAEAAGLDLRGLPLSCLFSTKARPQLAEALDGVIKGRALAELDLGIGQGGAVARLLLLPVVDGPNRRLVLGCLGHHTGALGPRVKFEILRRQLEQLFPAPAMIKPNAPLPLPVRRLGHLTLVHARD